MFYSLTLLWAPFIILQSRSHFLCEALKNENRARITLLGKGKDPIETYHPSSLPSSYNQNYKFPSLAPTKAVTNNPSSSKATNQPLVPTNSPTVMRTNKPSVITSKPSTSRKTSRPTMETSFPTLQTTNYPTTKKSSPSLPPTSYPTEKTSSPSLSPTYHPTVKTSSPSLPTTSFPTMKTSSPSKRYSNLPSSTTKPSKNPSRETHVPSQDQSLVTSQKPSKQAASTPSASPVSTGIPSLSDSPSNDMFCEMQNRTIGTVTGNSSVVEYIYEISYYTALSNISKLMEDVERSVMNGLLPIVDNCDGVRMTSNSIIGINADPDDYISTDPCMNQMQSSKCSRVVGRLTFFFNAYTFNTTQVLIRIKEVVDYGDVEGRDEEIVDLRFVSSYIIGASGPISDPNDDEAQLKSFGGVPFYAWILIAIGGLAGIGILAGNLQKNFEMYRDVDSFIS